jgi:hypothetical protein
MTTPKNTEGKTEKSSALKFPYPVLNDKRDLNTILTILTEKENEFARKMKHTKASYKKSNDTKRKEKLKTFYKNIKEQTAKIEKQIEYIKINIKIKKIEKLREKKNEKDYKKEQYDELTGQLSRLTFFMKEANHSFLNESKLQQQQKKSSATTNQTLKTNESATNDLSKNFVQESLVMNEISLTNLPQSSNYYQQQQLPYGTNQWTNQQTPSVSSYSHLTQPQNVFKQTQPAHQQTYYHSPVVAPKQQTNENYIIDPVKRAEYIQNSLAIAIAQTAAAAHAHAAISAVAMNPPPPPQQNQEQISTLPTKLEIDKASSTFDNYKEKIKFLLGRDKSIVKPTNSLKTLISAYKEDDDDDEDEAHEAMCVDDKSAVMVNDDDDEYSSDNSDNEIDIIFKSNAKNLNYILPANKACGLQASLRYNLDEYSLIDNPSDLVHERNMKPSLLIAQRSAFSITCMGTSSMLTKNSSLKNILYKKFSKVK